jgi:hypothetical protein
VDTPQHRFVLSDWQPDVADQVRRHLDPAGAASAPRVSWTSPPAPAVPPAPAGPMKEVARDMVLRARQQLRTQLERLDERFPPGESAPAGDSGPAPDRPAASPVDLGGDVGSTAGSARPLRVVDINQATEEELASLPGVGVVKAHRAVTRRAQHGGFTSVKELADFLELKPHERVAVEERAVATPMPAADPGSARTDPLRPPEPTPPAGVPGWGRTRRID